MSFSGFWEKFNIIRHVQKARALRGLHSPEKLRFILERERSRSDRTGDEFSLVVFNLSGTGALDYSAVGLLSNILTIRIRATDEVGWFEKGRVGVVLPHTPSEGAWRFADNIARELAATTHEAPSRRVFTYPSKWWSSQDTNEPYMQNGDAGAEYMPMAPTSRPGEKEGGREAEGEETGEGLARGETNIAPTDNSRSVGDLEGILVNRSPVWKRLMDLAGSTVALVIFTPVMLLVAIAVKFTSRGPVFFKQQRAGLGGKPFMLLKFRSMCMGAEAKKQELMKYNERKGPAFKMEHDPRVTPIGRFIRKWSLDELPQLINVFVGDMSLVGPRPPTMDEVPQYDSWQGERLNVKPGITCIWQITARHDSDFNKWVRLDIAYKRKYSILMDFAILLKTLPAVISRKGAS